MLVTLAGKRVEVADDALDEIVHDIASAHWSSVSVRASNINNEGVESQIVYLRAAGMTDNDILEFLGLRKEGDE